ncbi:hypothetical protein [Clostridium chromiireducens]|uniref:hypothetical protein n=1 Tax=Clostridium chromiireducens TaxID=225345 RepID=UPI001116FACC|nr:hypothetical protein [Clostridium chromiireducens]
MKINSIMDYVDHHIENALNLENNPMCEICKENLNENNTLWILKNVVFTKYDIINWNINGNL